MLLATHSNRELIMIKVPPRFGKLKNDNSFFKNHLKTIQLIRNYRDTCNMLNVVAMRNRSTCISFNHKNVNILFSRTSFIRWIF